MALPPQGAEPTTDADVAQLLGAIEAELGVVFGSEIRVEAACQALREDPASWLSPATTEELCRLIPLAAARTSAPSRRFIDFALDIAGQAAGPWPVLRALLRPSAQCPSALDATIALAGHGRLPLDDHVFDEFAELVEETGSPYQARAELEKIAGLFTHGQPPAVAHESLVGRMVLDGGASGRLAARLLDVSETLPERSLVERVLGAQAARRLGSYLAFTRATHLDVRRLAGERGFPPLLRSLDDVERQLGSVLTRDVLAALGWARVSLGLHVRRLVGVSVDESLPLLLTPSESRLLDDVPGARQVFERAVVFAHGDAGPPAGHDAVAPPSGPGDPVRLFRTYNLVHAELLGALLDIAPLTHARVNAILEALDRITADFQLLFAAKSAECDELAGVYGRLRALVQQQLDAAPPDATLSAELTRHVLMFEDPASLSEVRTLHGLKRYLHQRGLALAFGLLEGVRGTTRTVDVAIVTPERVLDIARRVEYADFEPVLDAAAASDVPYGVRVVAEGFARQLLLSPSQSLPAVKVFCYGNEVHYYVMFRNHPLFIRIDYSPPLAGGMIDLQYYGVSKYDLGEHPDLSLAAVQACFRRLEFEVEVANTRIHARYDKERALNLSDVCDKAEALFRLVPYLMDVDWAVGQLQLSAEARRDVGEAWAERFALWGTLPVDQVLTRDRCGILADFQPELEHRREVRWTGERPYRDRFSGRPGVSLLAALRDAAAARGLPRVSVPERADAAAQIPLETHLLQPLRAAVARGELLDTPSGLAPAPSTLFDRPGAPSLFARLLGGDDCALRAAGDLAVLVSALEQTLRFETTGSVNGYDVQQAELELRRDTYVVHVLRDEAGLARLAFVSRGGPPFARRSSVDDAWQDNVSTDVAAIGAELRRNNIVPAWDTVAPAGPADTQRLRALGLAPAMARAPDVDPGDRVLRGMSASRGHSAGRVRFRRGSTSPRELEGAILAAPALRPEDGPALLHAAGVISTGGSVLSHAGLLAVQCGCPSLLVEATWERDARGDTRLVFVRTEYEEVRSTVAGLPVTERRNAREREDAVVEGDLLELQSERSLARVLGQSADAIALHEALRQLTEANHRLARATSDADVLACRATRTRARHLLERLLPRLDNPPLARHAARRLLWNLTEPDCADPGGLASFLRLLAANAGAGDIGRHVEAHVEALAALARAAAVDAATRIPGSDDPQEILTCRIDALRSADASCAASRALSGVQRHAGDEPPPPAPRVAIDRPALDRVTDERLREVWARTMHAAVRAASESGEAFASLRHRLGALTRLSDVLDVHRAEREQVARLQQLLSDSDCAAVRRVADHFVLWPADGGLALHDVAGWKAANLGELHAIGMGRLAPPWFVVSDRAFRDALACPAAPETPVRRGAHVTLGEAIEQVLRNAQLSERERAGAIRRLWSEVVLPDALLAELRDASRRLGGEDGTDTTPGRTSADEADQPLLAVRSSAREEDTQALARAGEFDTFLFVPADARLIGRIQLAWAGLWTERAIHDRAVQGAPPLGEGGGLIVQCMAWSRVSGVIQTVNVGEGRSRQMVINVGLGLGEGVVSGTVAADLVVVAKESVGGDALRFSYMTADKRQRVAFDERARSGTIRVDTRAHQRFRPALEYVELVELVQTAARLEACYGHPLDIEFAFEGPRLRVLQVRPVPGMLAPWRDTAGRYPLARSAGGRT